MLLGLFERSGFFGSLDDFGAFIVECGLSDAGFEGSPYTWHSGRIWQRLDRVLINPEWYQLFPISKIVHTNRSVSDHCGLLLSMEQNEQRGPTPFRFQNMWLLHEDFSRIVQNNWSQPVTEKGMLKKLQVKMIRLKKYLKWWNKYIFGNVEDMVLKA